MSDADLTLQILGGGDAPPPSASVAAPSSGAAPMPAISPEESGGSLDADPSGPTRLTVHPMTGGKPTASAVPPSSAQTAIDILSGKNVPMPEEDATGATADAPPAPMSTMGRYLKNGMGMTDTQADISETMAKNTIPSGLAANITWPADLFNLAYRYGEAPLLKKVASSYVGRDLSPEEEAFFEKAPLFGTGDIVQGAEKLVGIQPHMPQGVPAKYIDSMGQMLLARKPVGFKQGLSVGQAVGAGVGSQALGDVFEGTEGETPARLIGGIIGAKAPRGIAAGSARARNVAGKMGVGPKTEVAPGIRVTPQQQEIAARSLLDAAKKPDDLAQTLDSAKGAMVPGSNPTTAEVAPDYGVAQWQDALRSKNRDAFNQRSAEQTGARVGALEGVRGDGNPEAVGEFFSNHMQQLEALAEKEAAATEQRRQDMQATAGKESAAARDQVTGKTEEMGGFGKPQEYGATIREGLEESAQGSKARLGKLWDALKPYDKSPASGTSTVRTLRQIRREVNPDAGQEVTATEESIYKAIEGWKKAPTFRTLRDLNSQLSEAQRALRMQFGNESRPVRRILMLKDALRRDIQRSVDQVGNLEKTRGVAPESAIGSKLAGLVKQWYAFRDAGEPKTATAGADHAADPSGNAGGGEKAVSGVGRAEGDNARGSGAAAGDKGGTKTAIPEGYLVRGASDRGFRLGHGENGVWATDHPEYASSYGDRLELVKKPDNIYQGDLMALANHFKNAGEELSGPDELTAADWNKMEDYLKRKGYEGANFGDMHWDNANDYWIFGKTEIKPFPEDAKASVAQEKVIPLSKPTGKGTAQRARMTPDLSEGARKTWKAANRATVEHKEAFRQGPVGKVLKEGRAGARYSVEDSNVASSFFNEKDVSPENIQKLVKATGSRSAAVEAVQDAAVADLRRRAINPDGTLHAGRFDTWVARHQQALGAFPELKEKLTNARRAQQFMEDTLERHAVEARDFNKQALQGALDRANGIREAKRQPGQKFAERDPAQAVAAAFRKGPQAVEQIVEQVKGDAHATEGLKAAVGDYIMKNVAKIETDEESGARLGSPAAYRRFIQQHGKALKTVFGGQGLQNLEAVAADIRRSQAWIERAKLSGQSNTAQDALNVAKQGKVSILGRVMQEVSHHALTSGAVVGEMAGGHPVTGAVLGMFGKAAGAVRASGLRTIEQLQVEMALNPDLAREMLRTLDPKQPIPIASQRRIATSLMRDTAIVTPSASNHPAPKKEGNEP